MKTTSLGEGEGRNVTIYTYTRPHRSFYSWTLHNHMLLLHVLMLNVLLSVSPILDLPRLYTCSHDYSDSSAILTQPVLYLVTLGRPSSISSVVILLYSLRFTNLVIIPFSPSSLCLSLQPELNSLRL